MTASLSPCRESHLLVTESLITTINNKDST
jgi:hypothetical protein